MADFLAMADEIGSVYLSLPQYGGRLKMSKPIPPQLDEIYYPIDSRIGWIHKFVENIKERLTKLVILWRD